jgi:hypothetical protein
MADLTEIIKKGAKEFGVAVKDGYELTKATGKTVLKRTVGDDSPTVLPKDTEDRVNAKIKPKKVKP